MKCPECGKETIGYAMGDAHCEYGHRFRNIIISINKTYMSTADPLVPLSVMKDINDLGVGAAMKLEYKTRSGQRRYLVIR